MIQHSKTLNRHILDQLRLTPHMPGSLATVFAQMTFAAKIVAREMRRAALVGELGLVGQHNFTGDDQKKLDIFANEVFIDAITDSGLIAGLVSEEMAEMQTIACGPEARYIVAVDPFDGSSNADVNGAVGSIIGIYHKPDGGCDHLQTDLTSGAAPMVAAIYVMYGPSTVFVYTCGAGVYGFTLDHDLGEFLLSHNNIRIPVEGHYYSANLGYHQDWDPKVQKFFQILTEPTDHHASRYSLRYSGAMVADVHRTLLEGGVYVYPPDKKHPKGKLRLLYECAPLSFIVEQAGGLATNGTTRISRLVFNSIHELTPIALGSPTEVKLYEKCLAE
ncbi:fructose-1,6-bisphosphatase [Methylacidiphilales bacterium]|nr:fructose-1,6-bisphosphatase [Candidatus Methylacidiphilales bacterium]